MTRLSVTRLSVITNSQMRAFRRCPREHYYSYALGYRPLHKAESLRMGDLVHAGLEAWWTWHSPSLPGFKGNGEETALEMAIDAMRARTADEFELVRAAVLLQGYDLMWGGEMDRYDVLGVESQFVVPLRNPETGAPSRTYELAGKIDVLVRDRRDGLVRIVEHKTTGEDLAAGSEYWRRLQIDSQVSTYFAGAKALGHDVAECIYDVIKKPALRPGTVPLTDEQGAKIVVDKNGERVRTQRGKWRETGDSAQGYTLQTRPETPDEFRKRLVEHISEQPDRYYQRATVVRLEQEERAAAFDVWQLARNIREAELSRRWPRNPDACSRYGRTCDFFDVCTGTASLDDETQFRRTDNPHEELS
jgi:CRISPR/Cas system-associated exonuclease Cas4 (RecB family)